MRCLTGRAADGRAVDDPISPEFATGQQYAISDLAGARGASMCNTRYGQKVGSGMGNTALNGPPIRTRSGELDRRVVLAVRRIPDVGRWYD